MAVATRVMEAADAGLPYGLASLSLRDAKAIPTLGTPVLIVHGPIATRAALGIVSDSVLVRPLTPFVHTTRIHRHQVADIDLEDGPWYARIHPVARVKTVKGSTLRLVAAPPPGGTAADMESETESLCRLLRAWWSADGAH